MIELLSSHPDEWQIWSYHAEWLSHKMAFMSHVWGFLFQGENGWRKEAGNHMAWRQGADTFSAEWPAVCPRSAVSQIADIGQTIHAYAFNPPLSDEEKWMLQRWILEKQNTPYDIWLCTNRALARVAALTGRIVPVVDFTGEMAFICYEYIARGINLIGYRKDLRIGVDRMRSLGNREIVNPTTFGPPDLWALAAVGRLTYRGIVTQESAA